MSDNRIVQLADQQQDNSKRCYQFEPFHLGGCSIGGTELIFFTLGNLQRFFQPNYTKEINDACLLYTSDAADDTPCVDLGGRRIIKKKKSKNKRLKTKKEKKKKISQDRR
eukprot:TRINITY_DN43930_c0_g1_i1.p3 TRINITY_DN43930_c0_g1~~TRINITY_DN43930_c0_g1_i1.p3  ORF type:complete len:110 (+),score=16.07 TRINITY_DN43930_c0_g1_i1:881-1210(+)